MGFAWPKQSSLNTNWMALCCGDRGLGPLMGSPQCRLSILRNGNVPCRYFLNFPVDFKIVQCRLSILWNDNVLCRYFSNLPVDFKIVQCRLSNLRKSHVALSILRVKGPGLGALPSYSQILAHAHLCLQNIDSGTKTFIDVGVGYHTHHGSFSLLLIIIVEFLISDVLRLNS